MRATSSAGITTRPPIRIAWMAPSLWYFQNVAGEMRILEQNSFTRYANGSLSAGVILLSVTVSLRH